LYTATYREDGSVIETIDGKPSEWSFVVPESIGEGVLDAVCHHRKKSLLQIPRDETLVLQAQYISMSSEKGKLKGLTLLNEAVRINPRNAAAYDAMGNIYRSLKQYRAAIVNAKRAVKLEPKEGSHYRTLGDIYSEQNETTEAEVVYRQAFQLEPDSVLSCYSLGSLLAKNRSRLHEAADILEKCIKIDPSWTSSFEELIKTYETLDKPEKRREALSEYVAELRKELKAKPDAVWTWHYLSEAYKELRFQEEWKDAKTHLIAARKQMLISADATAPDYYFLAQDCEQLERYSEAVEYYQRVLTLLKPSEKWPRRHDVLMSLTDDLVKLESWNEAESYLRIAFIESPADGALLVRLGEIALKRGDLATAKAQYSELVQRHLDKAAQKLLDQINGYQTSGASLK
jgi:tetratricopeptide (TPR) repeat protein